jgi:AcrR family transcriptional regulator
MNHIIRRQREKDELRNRILAAARKIAAEEGWSSVTIRKIAEEIEYTPPIVYEYFESKEDLIKELIYMGFRMLKEEVERARLNEKNTKKFLKTFSLINWDFAFNNKELYQLMFSLERPTPSEEMRYSMKLIKETFTELAHHDQALAEELGLYWICLTQGAVSVMMHLPPPPNVKRGDPRERYGKIVDRFIKSI